MHVLAPEFGLPPVLSLRLFKERCGYVIDVGSADMALDHPVKPLSEIALELHLADIADRICPHSTHHYQQSASNQHPANRNIHGLLISL